MPNWLCSKESAEERSFPGRGGSSSQWSVDMELDWHKMTVNGEKPATAEKIFEENVGPVMGNKSAVKVFI
jgi:hypothetical protein